MLLEQVLGGSLKLVINQLHSIGSSLQVSTKEGKIMSLGDGLARGLKRYMRAKSELGLKALLMGETDVAAAGRSAGRGDGNGSNGQGKGSNGKKMTARAGGEETLDGADNRAPTRFEGVGIQWQQTQYKVRCPDCQGELRFGEGCVTCDECGFSKC